jgi:nitroreductase
VPAERDPSAAEVGVTAAMRTTASTREFTDRAVDDATLHRILDAARFAPSGGNRQPWTVLVIRDPEVRTQLAALAQQGWNEYVGYLGAGLVPFAVGDDGIWPDPPRIDLDAAGAAHAPNPMLDAILEVPALLVVLADLTKLAVLDGGIGRHSIVGGGSVYPFVQNLLLAARAEGLGGVMTTFLCRREAETRALLGFPAHVGVAAMVVLGEPVKQVTRLRRRPVEEFTHLDHWDGEPFAG